MLDIKFSLSGSPKDPDIIHQARAVVTTLTALFGSTVLDGLPAVAPIKIPSAALPSGTAPIEAGSTVSTNVLAPDGYPVDVDAATAFGAAHADEEGPAAEVAPGELDADGIPWDERIHASTKTKTAKGTWTRRRNTPDATFDGVMAELNAAKTARTMEAAKGLVPPPPSATPAPPPPPPAASAPTSPAPAPVPSPPPVAPGASSTGEDWSTPATTFASIMSKVTKAQAANKINGDGVKNLLGSLGMAGIIELNSKPEKIPEFDLLLVDHINTVA